ncbi:hypothetical protein RF11_06943 [Thelohanellus kitauei]|uniref:Uncharacterized protein n=1 Tax=Thelohanellus kitauei TaxID=669202 RepID=A0A0C2MC47_THEKT|nr:hypothetical protein RF11_06943 [Thelohanellus kitauei]
MNKSTFRTLFIIITVAAFLCCAILVLAGLIPFMFVLLGNWKQGDVAHFGPFSWYHNGPIKSAESYMESFLLIRVLYLTLIVLTFLGPLAAIGGYRNKNFRKPAGIFVLACAVILGFFAFSYLLVFILSIKNGTLLYLRRPIDVILQTVDTIVLYTLMFTPWSMMAVFSVLGVMVLVHKFDYEMKFLCLLVSYIIRLPPNLSPPKRILLIVKALVVI